MNRVIVVCFLGLIMTCSGSVIGNPSINQLGNGNKKVARAESHPDLVVQISRVAQIKAVTRKSSFHLSEMVTLDIALLNTSSRPIFFRKLSDLRVKAQNAAGQQLTVQGYGVADRALVPDSFVLLPPGEIIVRSYYLLAGCDKRAFAQVSSAEDNDLTAFKNGSFLNWGDACLPITQPDIYTFSVEINNDFVVIPSPPGKLRTAVGRIESNSLEIKVNTEE